MIGEIAQYPWGVSLAYLASAMLFILALYDLRSAATARRGNGFGMVGMVLAMSTTLTTHDATSLPVICIAMAISAAIGSVIGNRIALSAVPRLVAGFHGLVGLSAMAAGIAAYLDPVAFGVPHGAMHGDCAHMIAAAMMPCGMIFPVNALSGVELVLGVVLGAISFAGSALALLMPRDRQAQTPFTLALSVSCTGWAAVAMGLAFGNVAMIATGALVGSSAATLGVVLRRTTA